MAKLSKRIKGFLESIDQSKAYNMQEAFKIIKENSKVKFNESVDVSINLGIDAIGVSSYFVFYGKFKAVLISYPTKEIKEVINE